MTLLSFVLSTTLLACVVARVALDDVTQIALGGWVGFACCSAEHGPMAVDFPEEVGAPCCACV